MFKNTADKSNPAIVLRLWKRSRNCFGGLGICFVDKHKPKPVFKSVITDNRDEVVVSILPDNKFIVLEFSSDVSGFSSDELQFAVEDTLSTDLEESTVIIPQGVYEFDKSIGKWGGYQIPLNLN